MLVKNAVVPPRVLLHTAKVISISRVVAHFTSNCGNPEALGGRNISWPESDHFLTNLFSLNKGDYL